MPIGENGVLTVDPADGFRMEGYWVWCGSVIRTSEGCHMFASRWSRRFPMFEGYVHHSEIVRAFSETPCGTYRFCGKVLPAGRNAGTAWDGRMAHNPAILYYRGRYWLYHIGTTCTEPAAEMSELYRSIRIGLAVAEQPEGPWRLFDRPLLEPVPWAAGSPVTNPAPCVAPDGRIYLYFRVNTSGGLRIGLAVADFPEGPYRTVSDGPILSGFHVEDPFVWHDGCGFRMLAKDMDGSLSGELHAGVLFVSADGVLWRCHGKAYSRTVRLPDGNELQLGALERPWLLADETGNPEYLFAAAADGTGGFRNARHTWNQAISLGNGNHLLELQQTSKGEWE